MRPPGRWRSKHPSCRSLSLFQEASLRELESYFQGPSGFCPVATKQLSPCAEARWGQRERRMHKPIPAGEAGPRPQSTEGQSQRLQVSAGAPARSREAGDPNTPEPGEALDADASVVE